MYLLDQRTLGIVILVLLGILVIAKQIATGSILDKPKGKFLVQLVNIFNLFFLLIVNPLVAILLITGHLETFDRTRLVIENPSLVITFVIVGLILYIFSTSRKRTTRLKLNDLGRAPKMFNGPTEEERQAAQG